MDLPHAILVRYAIMLKPLNIYEGSFGYYLLCRLSFLKNVSYVVVDSTDIAELLLIIDHGAMTALTNF